MEKQEESKKPEGQMLLHLPGVEGTSTEKDHLVGFPSRTITLALVGMYLATAVLVGVLPQVVITRKR